MHWCQKEKKEYELAGRTLHQFLLDAVIVALVDVFAQTEVVLREEHFCQLVDGVT